MSRLEKLDNWHHRTKFPGSWIFCDLYDWSIWGNEGIPMLIRERLYELHLGPDPYKR